jgi:hypothetical protein
MEYQIAFITNNELADAQIKGLQYLFGVLDVWTDRISQRTDDLLSGHESAGVPTMEQPAKHTLAA